MRLPQVLTRAELARAREPIDEIVALAQPEVERLFLRLRGYGFIVSLAERGGATVLFRGDVPLPEAFASTRNVLGAISCEERQGTNGIGTCLSIGKPLAQFAADEPNDGLVSVAETRLPGATAHLTLPVSHTGMLFSADVARQGCEFLATGRFQV